MFKRFLNAVGALVFIVLGTCTFVGFCAGLSFSIMWIFNITERNFIWVMYPIVFGVVFVGTMIFFVPDKEKDSK